MYELYEKNRGLLTRWARMFSGAVEFEDLMQECFLALCAAVSGFNSSSGVLFASYLETVVKRHLARVSSGSGALHLSESMAEAVRAYRWERLQFQLESGADPDDQTIAARLHWKLEKVQRVRRAADLVTVSLDKPMTEDGATLAETLEDGQHSIDDLIDSTAAETVNNSIWAAVDALPERQAAVIKSRYKDNKTMKQAGEELNISPARVQQLTFDAMRTLRQPGHKKRLYAAMDYYGIGVHCSTLAAFRRTGCSSVERAVMEALD